MRWILALLIALTAGSAALAAPAVVKPHFYGVIFEISTDQAGKVDTLLVSKVMDAATGTTDAIDLAVPEVYIAAAREWLRRRTYKPNDHFFTYTLFDPLQPSRADLDPKAAQP